MPEAQRPIVERVREWHSLRQRVPRLQPEDRKAGRNAEAEFEEIARSSFNDRDAAWFSGRRVPRPSATGRYEIDQIILTHKHVYLVEVKNWSGALSFSGRDFQIANWVQRRRDGSTIDHGPIWQRSTGKEEALRAYLQCRGYNIPATRFSTVFLFINKNLSVPKEFHDSPLVVLRHQLDTFLASSSRSNMAERLISSLISLVLDRETHKLMIDGLFGLMSEREWNAIATLIEPLKQFDQLRLYGGETVSGDVLEVDYGEVPKSLDSLCAQRSSLTLKWQASALTLPLLLLGKSHLGTLRSVNWVRPASAYGRVRFQAAAARKWDEFPISMVEEIYRG